MKLGKTFKAVGINLLELAYCVYLYGRKEEEEKKDCLNFLEFSKQIRQIHEKGKTLKNEIKGLI